MQVKCAGCGKTFAFHPEPADLMESKREVRQPEDLSREGPPKSRVVKCPHCGTNNRVRG